MKALRLLEYGGQLVFNDVPTPAIARDEILVKIKSTAVNHLDLVEAEGREVGPGARRKLYEILYQAISDARAEVLDVIAEGDKVALVDRFGGTHRGELLKSSQFGGPL